MTAGKTLRENVRPFESGIGHHLFVADGSRIFDVEQSVFDSLRRMQDWDADEGLRQVGFDGGATGRWIDGSIPPPPEPKSLSLNVAQACNLGCGYCYADGGKFGGKPRMMEEPVAFRAVDMLLDHAEPGGDVVIGFMGGEPLLARVLIRRVVEYASRRAALLNVSARFSITTNGTVVTEEDASLFTSYPFAVQLSLDGPRSVNDAQRPSKNGTGSYDRALRGLETLVRRGRPAQLTARATITRGTPALLPVLDHLISLPFDDVGFALALSAPPGHAIQADGFDHLLEQMIACGKKALTEALAGRRYPFSNFLVAMDEIHRGTHRPYPCGAGAAYLSVNAEGSVYACHRTIDDPKFALGDLEHGLDHAGRAEMMSRNHVDSIDPCRSCWARYLCGGGCYHEVSHRGRPACDYIRGWLEFCLKSYVELSSVRPEGLSQHGHAAGTEGAAHV
jgi:uncharacterized protein